MPAIGTVPPKYKILTTMIRWIGRSPHPPVGMVTGNTRVQLVVPLHAILL
jgi:hypothetical protein